MTQPSHITCGWLGKMKRHPRLLSSNWNKRWIVLSSDALEWRHAKDSEASGSIKLGDVEKVYKLNSLRNTAAKGSAKTASNDTVLIVKTAERNLCLAARSSEECDRWFRAIQMQLDLREGGTVSGPRPRRLAAVSARNRRLSNGGGDKYTVSKLTTCFWFAPIGFVQHH